MTETTTPPVVIDMARPKIPFARLVSVELRKMFDTRAGVWLVGITAGLMLLVMAVILLVMTLADNATISAQGFAEGMTFALSLLLPVFAIITVTSEWGQRNHLTLFTLEPHRAKVFGAKLLAVTLLALSTIVVAVIFGAVGNVLYGVMTGNETVWNVDISDLAWIVGLQLVYFLMAFAIASLLLNTPGSIVLYYAVGLLVPFMVYTPLIGAGIGFGWTWPDSVLPWVDVNMAASALRYGTSPMGEDVDAGAFEVVRFIFTLVLWIGVPGVLGFLRISKTEIK